MSTNDDGVLVVGAGFGGLEVATHLARKHPTIPVTVVNPAPDLTYRPWLIHIPPAERDITALQVPLGEAARRRAFSLVVDSVVGVDPEGKAELASGRSIRFGACVVATGARTDSDRIAGTKAHACTPCDLEQATAFAAACRRLRSGTVTVVASGERPGPGLEYAGWLVRGLELGRLTGFTVTLVDDGALIRVLGDKALRNVARHFARRGHSIVTGTAVTEITAEGVRLANGTELPSDLTAVVGPLCGGDAGLPADAIDDHGFVRIDDSFRSLAYPRLFAVGDAAGPPGGQTVPKSMVLARRQAPTVANNVAAALAGRPPTPFDLSIARRFSIAMPDFGGRTVMVRDRRLIASGRWPLLLRTLIDRSFFRSQSYRTRGDLHR